MANTSAADASALPSAERPLRSREAAAMSCPSLPMNLHPCFDCYVHLCAVLAFCHNPEKSGTPCHFLLVVPAVPNIVLE